MFTCLQVMIVWWKFHLLYWWPAGFTFLLEMVALSWDLAPAGRIFARSWTSQSLTNTTLMVMAVVIMLRTMLMVMTMVMMTRTTWTSPSLTRTSTSFRTLKEVRLQTLWSQNQNVSSRKTNVRPRLGHPGFERMGVVILFLEKKKKSSKTSALVLWWTWPVLQRWQSREERLKETLSVSQHASRGSFASCSSWPVRRNCDKNITFLKILLSHDNLKQWAYSRSPKKTTSSLHACYCAQKKTEMIFFFLLNLTWTFILTQL